MPLREENRVMVHYGLQELTQTRKLGLQALRQVSGRTDKSAGVGEVGFQLAPRLNASGRLGSATHSVQLLTASDAHEATHLAQFLNEVNQQRRTLQQAMEEAVHERIAQQYNGHPPAAIVLGDPAWHLGVVGIVAAKIVEAYHRPTFLLHINGATARGSGRSIPAFNLYRGLQHCAQWLRQFGGHKYAAGLTMDTERLPFLQEDLIRFAEDTLAPEDLHPTLQLDAVVPLTEVTPALVADLERCAPHGAGNPVPLFCAQAVEVASPIRLLGQQQQHARFRVAQAGARLDVVAFHQAAQVMALPAGAVVDIAFTPTINTWRDQHTLELHLRALRPHTPRGQG
jgi:single-stranded-DNA-specific exonuclease